LRDLRGLTKDVAIIGAGDHAEIWDAAAWAKVDAEETTPENIAAIMAEFGI